MCRLDFAEAFQKRPAWQLLSDVSWRSGGRHKRSSLNSFSGLGDANVNTRFVEINDLTDKQSTTFPVLRRPHSPIAWRSYFHPNRQNRHRPTFGKIRPRLPGVLFEYQQAVVSVLQRTGDNHASVGYTWIRSEGSSRQNIHQLTPRNLS